MTARLREAFYSKSVYTGMFVACSIYIIIHIITSIPFFVFKTVLALIVRAFHIRGLQYELDDLSAMFADTSNMFLVSVLQLQGNVTRKNIIELLERNVFTNTAKNCIPTSPNQMRCRKMKQYRKSFLGYWFWKLDPNFDFNNHVKELPLNVTDDTDYPKQLATVHTKLANLQFERNKSPWDIIIFTSYKENACDYSFAAVRFDHYMADGKSMVKFVAQVLAGKESTAESGSLVAEKFTLLKLGRFLFRFIQHTIKTAKIPYTFKDHPWLQKNPREDDSPYIVKISRQIPIDSIKSIAGISQQVCTSSVILAVAAGAIKRYFAKEYQTRCVDPFPIMYSLPRANHPDYLSNHFESVVFDAPVGGDTGSEQIAKCNDLYTNMKIYSGNALHTKILVYAATVFPRPVRNLFHDFNAYPVHMSNISGEKEALSVDNLACTDHSFCVGPGQMKMGVMCYVFGYEGRIRFYVTGKSSVIDEAQCELLISMFEEEMDEYIKMSNVDSTKM